MAASPTHEWGGLRGRACPSRPNSANLTLSEALARKLSTLAATGQEIGSLETSSPPSPAVLLKGVLDTWIVGHQEVFLGVKRDPAIMGLLCVLGS